MGNTEKSDNSIETKNLGKFAGTEIDDNNEFGKRLRKLRKNRDITQKELAEYLGVVTSAIGKYELHPDAYPSIEILLKISEYFDESTDYLLKGIEPNSLVENNISGTMSNSPFIQANNGGVVVNGKNKDISVEAAELLRIYETLNGRERIKLLNFAAELERGTL